MIGRKGKKIKNLQSSVIVPWNEIDSHPTEHEITLADDTAVTVPETQHYSNRNNQHLLAEQRHTSILSGNQLVQTVLSGCYSMKELI